MPRQIYSLRQIIFMCDEFLKTDSARAVVRRFIKTFPQETVPHRNTVQKLINKFRQTGSVCDKKRHVRRNTLTGKKLDEIGACLERSPTKSLRILAQETGISRESARKATKLLKLNPYKINSKYSEELAQESLEWIKAITNEDFSVSGDMDNFYETLKDGTLLCRLVNCIKPGSAKKINQSTMAFKCMENINVFLEAARDLGVPPQETFQTVDLWERQNLNSVVICLQSLGRKAHNFGKPSIGPKEAEKNVRNFSEEQMRASHSVISLQYGSNKGANQSGINFGNTRHM